MVCRVSILRGYFCVLMVCRVSILYEGIIVCSTCQFDNVTDGRTDGHTYRQLFSMFFLYYGVWYTVFFQVCSHAMAPTPEKEIDEWKPVQMSSLLSEVAY